MKKYGEIRYFTVFSLIVQFMLNFSYCCYFIYALELGNVRVANIVLIGALMGATDIVSKEVLVRSLEEKFKSKKPEILELNMKALEKGIELGKNLR